MTELTSNLITTSIDEVDSSIQQCILAIQNPPSAQYLDSLKDLSIDSEKKVKPRIKVPLFMTFLLKKIYWAEKHKTFNLSATIIMRIIVDDLFDILKATLGAESIQNPMAIIQSLTKYSIRVNDLTTITLEGVAKPLNIYRDQNELKTNQASTNLDYKKISLKDKKYNEELKNLLAIKKIDQSTSDVSKVSKGYASTFREQLTDILINSNVSMSNYPYNYQDIILKLEVEPVVVEVEVILEDGSEETYLIEFNYEFRDSIIPQNVFSAKLGEVDDLDTHDSFENYHGYRYCLEKSVAHLYISLKHDPDFAYQFTLLPMHMLQAFQIVICIYGDPASQLANLISVYIAYGAFAIIASQDNIMTKDISILDELYYVSLGVSIFQFINLLLMSVIDPNQEQCNGIADSYTNPICFLDGLTITIAFCTFVYSIIEYFRLYNAFLKKRHISEMTHDEIINKDSDKQEKEKPKVITDNSTNFNNFIKNAILKETKSIQTQPLQISKSFKDKADEAIHKFNNLHDISSEWFYFYKMIYGINSKAKGGDVILLEEWRLVNSNYIKNKDQANKFDKGKLIIQSMWKDPFYVEYYINRYLY